MSSIIGQAMETGAGGAMGAGGPSLSGIGSFLGPLLSGITGGGTPTVPTPPTDTASSLGEASSGVPWAGMGYAPPSAETSSGGLFPTASPGDVMSPSGMAGANFTPTLPNTPENIVNPGSMGGTSAAPFSPAAGDPSAGPDPTFLQELENFFGVGSGAGTSGAGGQGGAAAGATNKGGLGAGGWINLAGGLMSAINKWMVQRTLQNPAALASAASKLARPLGAQARNRITAPVTAAAMETSGVNAPLLYSQAIASALAPYQFQNEQNALEREIAALTASESGGFATPNYFGGQASATG